MVSAERILNGGNNKFLIFLILEKILGKDV